MTVSHADTAKQIAHDWIGHRPEAEHKKRLLRAHDEALDALVAIIERQADRIAWLEGDVAGWRIKLDAADAALQWIAEHYPAALRELPTDEWLRLRRASTSLAETPTEATT